jgi:hypothetical protein
MAFHNFVLVSIANNFNPLVAIQPMLNWLDRKAICKPSLPLEWCTAKKKSMKPSSQTFGPAAYIGSSSFGSHVLLSLLNIWAN